MSSTTSPDPILRLRSGGLASHQQGDLRLASVDLGLDHSQPDRQNVSRGRLFRAGRECDVEAKRLALLKVLSLLVSC